MGLFKSRWEAEHRGHRIVVARNEVTKGFRLEWDGQEVARRTWSLTGVGELLATVQLDGKPTEVRAVLDATFGDGQCSVEVGSEAIPVRDVA